MRRACLSPVPPLPAPSPRSPVSLCLAPATSVALSQGTGASTKLWDEEAEEDDYYSSYPYGGEGDDAEEDDDSDKENEDGE